MLAPPSVPAISLSRANKTENDTHTLSFTAEGVLAARILSFIMQTNLDFFFSVFIFLLMCVFVLCYCSYFLFPYL